ncbi:TetR/AcrR family transcriptional regulator [Amycolatopsis suaedae]|uniref:TetR/AcrR family transcriptional regulator n=1 Tax=Amycolatopsis suaedae TaxID=2510978 RepID=A0A4Q7J9T6_9PSEU|nr:TetR/AcrR family transcriptional regulator [Amycolatopsis suaedae]RZQ62914.1 TetR/AcrR family transcriptional regulator [Amycolatopsis suaedae]
MNESTRDRILRAAADLLTEGGPEAVSTRAVSAAAGVQAPTLYRLFGDKSGLLDAVASYGFGQYLARKQQLGETGDPVDDLRRGWNLHIEFGQSHPEFYALMYGGARTGAPTPAMRESMAILHRMVTRVAQAGRLATTVGRGADIVHSASVGVVLSQNALPAGQRDPELPALVREMVLATITTDAGLPESADVPARAVALRTALQAEDDPGLSPGENLLLSELLDRLTRRASPGRR